jgi:hypothetical protein
MGNFRTFIKYKGIFDETAGVNQAILEDWEFLNQMVPELHGRRNKLKNNVLRRDWTTFIRKANWILEYIIPLDKASQSEAAIQTFIDKWDMEE